MLKCKTS